VRGAKQVLEEIEGLVIGQPGDPGPAYPLDVRLEHILRWYGEAIGESAWIQT